MAGEFLFSDNHSPAALFFRPSTRDETQRFSTLVVSCHSADPKPLELEDKGLVFKFMLATRPLNNLR